MYVVYAAKGETRFYRVPLHKRYTTGLIDGRRRIFHVRGVGLPPAGLQGICGWVPIPSPRLFPAPTERAS